MRNLSSSMNNVLRNAIPSFLVFLACIAIPSISLSQTLIGKVISVADGDTITVLLPHYNQIKIRLSAVDCPESGQAYGRKAKKFTSKMVYGKQVTVKPVTTDRYGRIVAMVYHSGANLSEQIIANGYGWVFRKYCKWAFCNDWLRLEKNARDRLIGLWRDKHAMPPWEWRKVQRGNGQPSTRTRSAISYSNSGRYHGNVRSHVFHGPGCQHYNCKNCVKLFRSKDEAIKTGYRPHKQCIN